MRKAALLLLTAFMTALLSIFAASPEARRSFRQFEQRADAGDPEAQFRLAMILEKGWDSIPADSARALGMIRAAADAGYPPAMNYIGYLYGKGYPLPSAIGIRECRDSMLFWLRRSAETGDARAMSNLAFLLLEKRDEKSDSLDETASRRHEAIGYLERASALGAPTAMSMLAELYARGDGLPLDSAKAAALWLDAAGRGLADAELRLISLMGAKWEKMDSDSAFLLGKEYYEGKTPTAGVILLERAATLPYETDMTVPLDSARLRHAADAMTLLGEAYSRGRGVRYDHDRALLWYAKGALAGNPDAAREIEETLRMFPDAMSDFSDEIEDFSRRIDSLKPAACRPASCSVRPGR